jgi:hypothetical protein
MADLATLKKALNDAYAELGSWRRVAEAFDISKPLAYRIARRDYEPKTPELRAHLGLPAHVAQVISVNGPIPKNTQVPGHALCVRCGAPFTPHVHNRTHCYQCVARGGKSPTPQN